MGIPFNARVNFVTSKITTRYAGGKLIDAWDSESLQISPVNQFVPTGVKELGSSLWTAGNDLSTTNHCSVKFCAVV